MNNNDEKTSGYNNIFESREIPNVPDYYGQNGRLSERAAGELIESAYYYECKSSKVLLKWINYADLAHTVMLAEAGIIPQDSQKELLRLLLALHKIDPKDIPIRLELGDIYNSREAYLRDRIGNHAGWLHAGRPRREAITIAYQLVTRKQLLELINAHINLANVMLRTAKEHTATLMPDYTYLQHAHPTSLGHYILTFVFPILRDLERLSAVYGRLNASPAGSGSVNGSRLPLNRLRLMELLGFERLIHHTRDAMWQPDIPIELISSVSALLVGISRFAEELQIWSTLEFNLGELPDELCRVSVIMPQKKNPYSLAFIRGLANYIIGKTASYAALGRTVSGNPDSRIFICGELSEILGHVTKALKLMTVVIRGFEPNIEQMQKRVMESFSHATDLADLIMLESGLDYRTAHQVMGRTVRKAIQQGLTGSEITVELIQETAREVIGRSLELSSLTDITLADLTDILRARTGIGGASEESIGEMITFCEDDLRSYIIWVEKNKDKHARSLNYLLKTAGRLCG